MNCDTLKTVQTNCQ